MIEWLNGVGRLILYIAGHILFAFRETRDRNINNYHYVLTLYILVKFNETAICDTLKNILQRLHAALYDRDHVLTMQRT